MFLSDGPSSEQITRRIPSALQFNDRRVGRERTYPASEIQSRANERQCPLLCPRGFTLIEIMLVVLLLGIIAGLAVPNLGRTYYRILLNQTTQQMAYVMRYAQSRAIIKKDQHEMVIDTERNRYYLTQEKISDLSEYPSEPVFERISGRLGRNFEIPKTIQLQTADASIRFYPDGRIDKAVVSLCYQTQCLKISTQQQSGYVNVLESATDQ